MRIERLILKNYRGFEALDLTFPDEGPTVFVGANGSGKSSLLHVIGSFAGCYNEAPYTTDPPISSDRDVRAGASDLSVELQFRKGGERRRVSQRSSLGRLNGPAKRNGKRLERREVAPEPLMVFSATRRPADFAQFVEWYRHEENAENELRLTVDAETRSPKLSFVRRAWDAFLRRIGVDGGYRNMRFTRVGVGIPHEGVFVVDKAGDTLTLDQLSDGESGLLLLVGTIAMALVANVDEPRGGTPVILVDELDLHLHPAWQRHLLAALHAAFPSAQVIGTSHSPLVVGHLKPENVVLLDNFEARQPISTFGREASDILVEVMGTPSRSDDVRALLDQAERALDLDDLEAAKAHLERMRALVGLDDPEVVRLQTELAVASIP